MRKTTCEHSGVIFETKDDWISVKDKLPEDKQRILAYVIIPESSEKDIVIMFHDETKFYPSSLTTKPSHDFTDIVTHWMALPEPPE